MCWPRDSSWQIHVFFQNRAHCERSFLLRGSVSRPGPGKQSRVGWKVALHTLRWHSCAKQHAVIVLICRVNSEVCSRDNPGDWTSAELSDPVTPGMSPRDVQAALVIKNQSDSPPPVRGGVALVCRMLHGCNQTIFTVPSCHLQICSFLSRQEDCQRPATPCRTPKATRAHMGPKAEHVIACGCASPFCC